MPVLLSSWAEWNFYFLCLVVVAVGAVAAMGGRVRGQAFCMLLFTGSTTAILYCCTVVLYTVRPVDHRKQGTMCSLDAGSIQRIRQYSI